MEVEKEPSIGISYNVELPGKKALVLQSFVSRDADEKDLNATLDKMRIAADRQFAFGAIQACKMQLEQEQKLADDHARRMAQVDENIKRDWVQKNRRGDPQLTTSERQAQQQAYAQAEESKKRIAKVKADIAEYEAIIAGKPAVQIGA